MILIYIKEEKKYNNTSWKKRKKRGANRPELNLDGLGKTVQKFISRLFILDGFKPSIINRLELFPDGFFQFLNGFKPSRICVFFFFFVVITLVL